MILDLTSKQLKRLIYLYGKGDTEYNNIIDLIVDAHNTNKFSCCSHCLLCRYCEKIETETGKVYSCQEIEKMFIVGNEVEEE